MGRCYEGQSRHQVRLYLPATSPSINEGAFADERVVSALQAYTINSDQNGYQIPDLSNVVDGQGTQGGFYFENGIQTPGLTTIPICTIDVVAKNWQDHGTNGNKPDGYPCNS